MMSFNYAYRLTKKAWSKTKQTRKGSDFHIQHGGFMAAVFFIKFSELAEKLNQSKQADLRSYAWV